MSCHTMLTDACMSVIAYFTRIFRVWSYNTQWRFHQMHVMCIRSSSLQPRSLLLTLLCQVFRWRQWTFCIVDICEHTELASILSLAALSSQFTKTTFHSFDFLSHPALILILVQQHLHRFHRLSSYHCTWPIRTQVHSRLSQQAAQSGCCSHRPVAKGGGSCQRTWPIVYIVFHSEDTGR